LVKIFIFSQKTKKKPSKKLDILLKSFTFDFGASRFFFHIQATLGKGCSRLELPQTIKLKCSEIVLIGS